MRPLEYRINLDFANESSDIFCNVRQGDNCSKIVAALREDGRAYDIEGDNLSVVFAALKSDGNTIYDDCTVENNTIIYDFNNQTAPVSGTVPCQFILIDSEGGEAKRISTPVFFLEISDNVDIDEENIVSSESYTALTNKIAQAQALINQIQHDLDTGAYKGDKGDPGEDGKDGFDPEATVTKSGNTATITITDKKGTTFVTVTDGADGFSPTATVTKSGHTATITITDKNGTTTAEISDGEGGDASNKMDLAPLNPTAEQISAMPEGQPYRVSNAREAYLFFKGTGGGKFYNDAYNSKHYLQNGKYSSQIDINQDTYTETSPIVQPLLGELLLGAANMPYLCVMSSSSSAIYSRLEQTSYKHKTVSANPNDYFYPSEKCMVDYVEAKIGDIESLLSEV